MSKILDIIFRTRQQGRGLKETEKGIKATSKAGRAGAKVAKAFGKAWSGAASAAGKAFRTALNGVLLLTTAVAGSIREFATFNVGMARAWTMMDVGVKRMREIRAQVVDLSAELGVAKSELVEGLNKALSSGVPADNAISFIATAAKVAVADGAEVVTSVDGITTVLNAWGLEATETEAVTDKLFQTVTLGKTKFGELAASMSQAAPVAASMGVSVDELLAAVATLTKQGVPTATAMVQIRNALSGTNEQLGDGWRKSRNFQEALEEIAGSANHSQQALTKIFGRETVAAISAMTGANFSNASRDLNSMSDSGGALQTAFGKVSSETSHWPIAFQTVRAVLSDIGAAFDKRLRPSINFIANRLNTIRKTDAFEKFAKDLADAAVGFIEKLLAGVITAGQVLKKSFEKGPAAMAATLITVLTEAFSLAGTVFIEFLRANINIFVTLGKVIGGAFKAEILKLDLPGINDDKRRKKAATKSLQSLTFGDASELGVNIFEGLPDPSGNRAAGNKISAPDARLIAGAISSREDGQDLLAQIAGSTSASEVVAAIAQGSQNFADSKGRILAQGQEALANIRTTGRNALGIDPQQMFNDTLSEIQTFTSGVSTLAANNPPTTTNTQPPTTNNPQPTRTPSTGPLYDSIQKRDEDINREIESLISITLQSSDGVVKKLEKIRRVQEEQKQKIDNLPL